MSAQAGGAPPVRSILSSIEELTSALQSQLGIDRERAMKIARANLDERGFKIARPSDPPEPPSVTAVRESRLEELEENDIRKLWLTLGGKVWATSTKRRARIAVGISDLILTFRAWGLAILWETKSEARVQQALASRDEAKRHARGRTPEQVDFGDDMIAGGVAYGTGTFVDFWWFLVERTDAERRRQLEQAADKASLQVPTTARAERVSP